jgi:hypothetical protein
MKTLEFKWTVSRGRDTYGYNICSLYVDGRKASSCDGGGYDMEGTALGTWLARAYAERLVGLKTRDFPAQARTLERSFYGLAFHDPDFDPGKAVTGAGTTVEQAEQDGESLGLERYQAFYAASSKRPSTRHRVPRIDGACGFSSVEKIAGAIGLTLHRIPVRSKHLTVYQLQDEQAGG